MEISSDTVSSQASSYLNPETSLEFDEKSQVLRTKTSLRMVYEAQSEVIRRQIGELEQVREKLGLNARKICQLLLVDPSAWNRWTRPGNTAPPHIWRALQWYMIVQEKLPGLTPQYFVERIVPRVDAHSKQLVESLGVQTQKLDDELAALRMQSTRLNQQIENQNRLLADQATQIQRLKSILIIGLCLSLGLAAGVLFYQMKKVRQASELSQGPGTSILSTRNNS